jgi:tRNA 2-thiocytidine biosynthesis protein TtcA
MIRLPKQEMKNDVTRLHRTLIHQVDSTLRKFRLLAPNDRVVVAISGGKDSLSLWVLMKTSPLAKELNVQLFPVHINPQFPGKGGPTDLNRLIQYFRVQFQEELMVVSRDFGPTVAAMAQKENPCFFCSRRRRQALYETARDLGCNKIAFAHHKDDVMETFLLNIFYGHEISTMPPKFAVFGGMFTIIRPLYETDENQLEKFAGEQEFPILRSPCPHSGRTKREEMKQLIRRFSEDNPNVRHSLYRALFRVMPQYLPGTYVEPEAGQEL